jgi:hypothetical protein
MLAELKLIASPHVTSGSLSTSGRLASFGGGAGCKNHVARSRPGGKKRYTDSGSAP